MADTDPETVGDVAQVLRVGTISAVDPATAHCKVTFGDPDEEPVETDWIQWLLPRAGETIVWAAPTVGEQVMLLSPGGDIAQAVALPGLYSDAFPQPGNGARQFVRFKDGAEFGYDPEAHAADVTLPGGGTLTIKATGGVAIEGDVAIKGRLKVSETIHAAKEIASDIDVWALNPDVSLHMHQHGAASASEGAPEFGDDG